MIAPLIAALQHQLNSSIRLIPCQVINENIAMQQAASSAGYQDSGPAFSPDGKQLAFVRVNGSIPSTALGGIVFISVALNWSPCSLSLTHQPSGSNHSPAVAEGSDPSIVTSSRCPLTLARSTQKPFSSSRVQEWPRHPVRACTRH